MPYSEHSAFKSPVDDSKIWRYYDFAKFVSILDKKALFFSRLDCLGDPYEGSVTQSTAQAREAAIRQFLKEGDVPEAGVEQLIRTTSDLTRDFRLWLFVNCWNMSDYESPALWTIYGKDDRAVALQSSYARLRQSLRDAKPSIHIGTMSYIDYSSGHMPYGNLLYPAMYKRKGFEHENELRAVMMNTPLKPNNVIDTDAIKATKGHNIPVDLHSLIERIYVAPTAPDWLLELVRSVINKYGINDKEIIRSDLALPPSF